MLGWEIERDRKNRILYIKQTKYIEDMLKKFEMQDSKPVNTPMDISLKLQKSSDTSKTITDYPYREAVGSLMYLALGTRPDIMTAVSYVSRHQENPQIEHITAVKRIF